jgi:hypothetical protein
MQRTNGSGQLSPRQPAYGHFRVRGVRVEPPAITLTKKPQPGGAGAKLATVPVGARILVRCLIVSLDRDRLVMNRSKIRWAPSPPLDLVEVARDRVERVVGRRWASLADQATDLLRSRKNYC